MTAAGEEGSPIELLVDGVTESARAYDRTNAATSKHYDDCQTLAEAAVPIAPLTKDDLRAQHARLAKVLECVRSAGYDLGLMISVDDFVAKGGAPDGLTSRWSTLEQDPGFLKHFSDCSKDVPSVPQSP